MAYLSSHRDALEAVRIDSDLRATVEIHVRALQARTEEVVHRYRDAIVAVADQLRTRRQLSGEEVRRIVGATAAKDQIESAQ